VSRWSSASVGSTPRSTAASNAGLLEWSKFTHEEDLLTGASVGSGDERSESPDESTSSLSSFQAFQGL
jgi:hypothetical protein